MDKKELAEKFNLFREICLKNAEDLLKGAKVLLDAKIDHASFHLSLLALEEIGKMEMEMMHTISMIQPRPEPITYNLTIDDHERKIFFAVWAPSFGKEKQTKDLLQKNHAFSKNLHEHRLAYLYSDPDNLQHWSSLMEKGEAKRLYDLVGWRLKMANAKSGLDPEKIGEIDENLQWFFEANEDENKRKEIWSSKSQEKLIELGDVKKWAMWLRGVYEKNEKEMREYAEKEMRREEPAEKEKMDPKWRVKIEAITPSHSIRARELNDFNKAIDWITINYKDKNTIGIEFILTKNIPVGAVWEQGWGISRMFLAALNIATNGFFWWNIKKDPSRYYEEIWDLENDAGVRIQMNPRLELDWRSKRLVLRNVDLSLTSIIFSYIARCHSTKNEEHLNHYVGGLSLLAKNDVHLRLEINSFEQFFKALKTAMIDNGDWDEKEPFEVAYQKATSSAFPEITDEMKKTFPLGFKVESEHDGFVDLTSVYAMKNYCEIYFQTLAARHMEKEGEKIRIVREKQAKAEKQ